MKSVFHAKLLAALAAALCLAAPLRAQIIGDGGGGGEGPPSGTVSPPAERLLTTPGGVDMRTGRYAYSATDLSIGEDNETGGLALTRSMAAHTAGHVNPFGNFSHNWDIMVTLTNINIAEGNYNCCGTDERVAVHFGGRSETFQRPAGQGYFDQVSRSGYARLTVSGAVYTFHANDGTVAVFRPVTSGECSSAYFCGFVSQVTHADGTRFSFEYDQGSGMKRLRAVVSNRGYALLLQYGGGADTNHVTSACVLNLAVQAKPANNACPGSPQAATSYSYTTVGSSRRLATAVDASNATSSFGYTPVSNPPYLPPGFGYAPVASGIQMAFTRPGDAAPWLTNTFFERTTMDSVDEIVLSQAFADGATYRYGYTIAPQVEGEIPQIAGGFYRDPADNLTTVEYGFYQTPGPYAQTPDAVIWQITPGPISITDPLSRVTTTDYCDPNAMANLPPYIHNRCLVMPVPYAHTLPGGQRTELTWDLSTRNLMQARRKAAGGSLPDIVTSSTYTCLPSVMTNCAKPTSTTDGRGNALTAVYDSTHGGLLSETGPAVNGVAPQTRHSYAQRYAWISNGAGGYVQAPTPVWVRTATSTCRTSAATGNPAAPCATAGDEILTQYDYGPDSGPNSLLLRGQTVAATDGGVTTILRTCYTYDDRGRRIGETQPNANLSSCPASQTAASAFTSNQRYDAMGRVTGTISASPADAISSPHIAVRNSYDAAGRLIKVETGYLTSWQPESVAPANWGSAFVTHRTAETAYDAMGRKTREQLREGAAGAIHNVTQYSYDIMSRVTCTAVRMNPAAFASLPASACDHSAYNSNLGRDRITRNVYDAASQRTQIQEGVGVTGEEAIEAQFTYTANGDVMNVIDGNGNASRYDYDGHGRRSHFWLPSPTTPYQVSYTDYEQYWYDANSNRTAMRRRDGRNILYAYDALNRLTDKTYQHGGATPVYYGYNLQGLQLSARYSSQSGAGITNMFDGFGRLTSSSTNLAGTTRTLTYNYDRNGNRLRITHPDGIWFSVTYDGLNRQAGFNAAGGVPIANIYHREHGAPWWSNYYQPNAALATQTGYSYDGVQRPSSIAHYIGGGGSVQWTFGRNAAGGLSSVSRDNDGYAWTSHYAVNRAYTTNGLNQYTLAGNTAMDYDDNGNLTISGSANYGYDVENRLTSAPGGVSLSYDPLGRLFQIAVNSVVTRTFLYDGDALVAEYGANGLLAHRYAHWVGTDVPMVSYASTAVTDPTFLYADHQGSIVAHANAGGTLSAVNRYDEYGIPAATNAGLFQYTGQIWLAEIGMYHYKARVYSPYLGRFLQTDPIGYEDQYNLYAYVGNDPINLTDPTGMEIVPTGTDAERQRMREFASRVTNLNVIERNGTWQIEGDVPRNSELNVPARELIAAINSSESITLNVVDGVQNVLWDDYVSAEIDVGDYEGTEQANARAAGALFAHVLAEQRYAAEHFDRRTSANFGEAHSAGSARETSAMGAFSAGQSPPQASTNSRVTRVYRDAAGHIVARVPMWIDGNGTPGPVR